eukprot:SAG22_NODE_689_length_7904_cov_3.365279_2_plen_128_part_00
MYMAVYYFEVSTNRRPPRPGPRRQQQASAQAGGWLSEADRGQYSARALQSSLPLAPARTARCCESAGREIIMSSEDEPQAEEAAETPSDEPRIKLKKKPAAAPKVRARQLAQSLTSAYAVSLGSTPR